MLSEKNKGIYSRSLVTRRSLIKAALTLAADKSMDSITFSDIARVSNMSRGTIYTYFEDVDELMNAASQQLWLAYRLEIALMFRQVDDAALKVALSLNYFLSQAREDSVFAWFLVRNRLVSDATSQLLDSDMEKIIAEGLKAKRFFLDHNEISAAVTLLRSVAIVASQDVLAGSSTTREDDRIVKLALKALGLSAKEADLVVTKPLLKSLVQNRRITQRLT